MKKIVLTLMLLMVSLVSAQAKPSGAMTKMDICNADAGQRSGVEKRAFMKQCLTEKKAAQRQRVKECATEAATKKSTERRNFLRECRLK